MSRGISIVQHFDGGTIVQLHCARSVDGAFDTVVTHQCHACINFVSLKTDAGSLLPTTR